MADINKLKDKIKSTIYPNGKGAINASDHQAMLLDMADGMAETDTKLATLSSESVKLYPQETLVDGALSIENDEGKLLLHQYDKTLNRNNAICNLFKNIIIHPTEALYSYKQQQQRFLNSIVKVALKGAWKLSETNDYYISYNVALSTYKRRIDVSAKVDGNKLRLGHFEIEWSDNDTIVSSIFIPNSSDNRTRYIEGYGLFDASMFADLPNKYDVTLQQGRIEIVDETTSEIKSIFSPLLKDVKLPYQHDLFVSHFCSIGFNVILDSPIYLTSLNKTMVDGNLSKVSMTFGQFINGVYTEVAFVESEVSEGEIVQLAINEKNNSGVQGVVVMDFKDSYFLSNFTAITLSSAEPYEIVSYSLIGKSLKEKKNVKGVAQYGSSVICNTQVVQNNSPILSIPMRQISKESNSHIILCVTADGVAYAKDGTYGNWLKKTTDFVTFENVQRFDIFINYVRETADGELLVFTGNNRENSDLAKVGAYKSRNGITSWKKVITPSTQYATFASWSIDIFGNKVLVGEYGDYSAEASERGSRYLYFSEDSGNSFVKILDLAKAPMFFDGFDSAGCHIHGTCYDGYWDRIWLVTGDSNMSKSLAWTDDKGATWKGISLYQYNGSDMVGQTLQFISVYAMRNSIILAPDCPYQHMFRVQKHDKKDIPIIEKAWAFRNTTGITHLTTGYKRFGANEPVMVMMGRGDTAVPSNEADRHNFILATFDGVEFFKIWEDIGFTKYPQKGVDVFKINGKYLIDIDHYELDSDGNEIKTHDWLWLTEPQWH